jgi:hypothetical protein
MTSVQALVVRKYVGLRRRFENAEARQFTQAQTPELLRAYSAFAKASQSGSDRQPFKGRDLWRILEAAAPRSIVELGSGTTSAVFALWAKRTGASYVAFEHDVHWASVTENCLKQVDLLDAGNSRVKHVASRVRHDGGATGFTDPLPLDVDFVYVDGPPCRLEDGRKVPNDDVTRLLDAGGLPQVIVIDGRLETVDLIRAHPRASNYRFVPSYVYSLRRGMWRDAIARSEHTLLIRT